MTASRLRRPTMRDVAREAGVSFKTVSRVVNGGDGVSAVVVARVEQAILALGYHPDGRARHLRSGDSRTGAIGFVLVDVGNPFFSSILRGIEEVARAEDCLVLAGSTDGLVDREDQLVAAFVARRVDGLIVVPSGTGDGALGAELLRGTPIVFLDLEIGTATVDVVRSDHYGGAYAATAHLLAHGHRDIAFFGDDPRIFSASLRLDGFRAALADAGVTVPDSRVVTGHFTTAVWDDTISRYLGRPDLPTAMFTAQNFVTIGGASALHRRGLQHRVAQVGFDDVDLAEVVHPGLTVVPQHPGELGRRAAELLFRRIDGSDEPVQHVVLASPIIERGSGEIAPPS